MSPLFSRRANLWVRLLLLTAGAAAVLGAVLAYQFAASPFVSRIGIPVDQPVAYSHALHAGALGLDCRYCHTGVETERSAGLPTAQSCMGCHSQVAVDSPALDPVRASLESGQPLAWVRVHDLPDYVYFDHAVHLRQGVGCESCHGRVDRMQVVAKAESLQMSWCLDCHRAPQNHLRPRDQVFAMGWAPPVDRGALGAQLVAEYGIHTAQLADCSVCHR